jgi:hypothetical protein
MEAIAIPSSYFEQLVSIYPLCPENLLLQMAAFENNVTEGEAYEAYKAWLYSDAT